MDPQELEQRKQRARDEGYSEEEINAALGTTSQAAGATTMPNAPIAPDPELDRSAEQNTVMGTGAALAAAGAAVPIGIGIGLGKYGGRAMDMARNVMSGTATPPPGSPGGTPIGGTRVPISTPTVPAVPTAPQMQPAPTTQAGRAYSPQAQQYLQSKTPVPTSPAPQMQAARSIVQKLALDKVMQSAGGMLRGGVGPGMALYSGGLNTNEDEELRRRRAMAPTITGQ